MKNQRKSRWRNESNVRGEKRGRCARGGLPPAARDAAADRLQASQDSMPLAYRRSPLPMTLTSESPNRGNIATDVLRESVLGGRGRVIRRASHQAICLRPGRGNMRGCVV